MKNKLGKEIKLYNSTKIDFNLKYQWKEGAIKEVEDIDLCYAYYECPFADIPQKSGIYLFCFPDGQYYIGQAKNLAARFTGHFYKFSSKECKDWHKDLGLRNWNRTKIFLQKYCNYYYMEVPQDQLDIYEQSALAQIVKNQKTELYYNTIFYKEEEGDK